MAMTIARDLLALVLAALAAFFIFLILSGGPQNVGELRPYVATGWWYVGPSLLGVSVVLAPILFMARRRGMLNLWTALALYALFPFAVSIEGLVVDPGSSSIQAALVYVASGLVAGLTYWSISRLPSNSTHHTDARLSSVLHQPPSARAGERGR